MCYRKYGLIGFTRDEREDSGRRRALSSTLKELIEALALQKPPLSIASSDRSYRQGAARTHSKLFRYLSRRPGLACQFGDSNER
jgi:hypothetical protein